MAISKAAFFSFVLYGLVGCNMASSHALIIDRYKAATCVPPFIMPEPSPDSREWNATLTLIDGSHAIVTGSQMPGGRVAVHYANSGGDVVAANAGDYVYPSDVRLNPQNDHLYIKASGLAAGIWQETWLFEFDLRAKKLLKRQKVADEALPTECATLR
jgi:hypothetical protein